ncbi:uncharacterized protein cd8b [Polymixia lowei]
MVPLALTWTVMTSLLWTSGSSQILSQETPATLYPKISESVTIFCDCSTDSCEAVYWFRYIFSNHSAQFLVSLNNAFRINFGEIPSSVETRLRASKRGSASFSLSITSVTDEDAGIYSCVLKNKNKKEDNLWKSIVLLRPGVAPPTLAPKIIRRPAVKPPSCCAKKEKKPPQNGCGLLVLWPLVGILLGLAVALISTLYYFSRLPKKCRHNFAKKRSVCQ